MRLTIIKNSYAKKNKIDKNNINYFIYQLLGLIHLIKLGET